MIQFKGGNGSSKEKAIIIQNVKTDAEGINAEYQYLDTNYPGWELVDQTILDDNGKTI